MSKIKENKTELIQINSAMSKGGHFYISGKNKMYALRGFRLVECVSLNPSYFLVALIFIYFMCSFAMCMSFLFGYSTAMGVVMFYNLTIPVMMFVFPLFYWVVNSYRISESRVGFINLNAIDIIMLVFWNIKFGHGAKSENFKGFKKVSTIFFRLVMIWIVGFIVPSASYDVLGEDINIFPVIVIEIGSWCMILGISLWMLAEVFFDKSRIRWI